MTRISRRTLMSGALTSFAASGGRLRTDAEDLAELYTPDGIDRAVQAGVDALLAYQREDGSITDRGHATAMTSLAIMALASVGVIPDAASLRGRSVAHALNYVLDPKLQHKGYFGHRDGSRMYGHGITTLMLTEMLGMGISVEQNERLHASLSDALAVILKAQRINKPDRLKGGWRYTPDSRDSDLSVSVWQVMALRSAKNDGLDIPIEAIDDAIRYLKYSYASPLDRAGNPRDRISGFAYTPGTHHPTFTMTSAGLLAMQTCGQYDSPLVSGASAWLLDHPPKVNDRFFYYGIYYYAQGMHQVGGEAAETAKRIVPALLLEQQSSEGFWQSRRGEERNYGRVYATALAILSLSVRYHFLPIYQR